ncbi:MAG: hypothetical protein WCJ92_02085 [Alphaproteobacteria bacterium]
MKLLKSLVLIMFVTAAITFAMEDEHSAAVEAPVGISKPASVFLGILVLGDGVPFDENLIVGTTSGDYSPGAIAGLLRKTVRNDVQVPSVPYAMGVVINDLKKVLQSFESGAQTNAEEVESAMNLLALEKPDVVEARRSLENILSMLQAQQFTVSRILSDLTKMPADGSPVLKEAAVVRGYDMVQTFALNTSMRALYLGHDGVSLEPADDNV